MTNFTHAKYGPDTVRIDDPTYVVPLLTEDVTVGTGLAFPAADTVAIEAGGVEKARFTSTLNSLAGVTTLLANSASAALTVTQTGAGNAFVVEDSASTDSTPFVIDASGKLLLGATASVGGTFGTQAPFQNLSFGTAATGRFFNDASAPALDFIKSRNGTIGSHTVVQSGDAIADFYFSGSDGTAFIRAAQITAQVDGTPGTNDMPGRLVFSTTADGASSPTEALRIDSTQSVTNTAAGSGTNAYGFRVTSAKTGGTNNYAFSGEIAAGANRYNFYAAGTADNYFAGKVGIGAVPSATTSLRVSNQITGGAIAYGVYVDSPIDGSTSTTQACYFQTAASISAGSTTTLNHYSAYQGTLTGTVGTQVGYNAPSSLTGATNNYGFYSNIAAATGRWNFYAAGTAANYFAGDVQLGKTVTAGGTTGAQTINKTVGTVNFAAAATSLVVTNSLVTANSIITATVGTNDTTMKSVAVVAAAGSFTLHANAAATAETRVNFHVFN